MLVASDDFSKFGGSGNRLRLLQLIDEHGENLGIVTVRIALARAKLLGLDLFLVQPDADPPVAQIMDSARYKFDLDRKSRELRKKHSQPDVIEIKMRYKIEEHDYQVKLRKARESLLEQNQIKFAIPLRGREMQHNDFAMELANSFFEDVKDLATLDKDAKIEGQAIIMILSPISSERSAH